MLAVEPPLDGERVRDRRALVPGQELLQPGHRVHDPQDRAVRVQRDRVEVGRPHETHCQSAHCAITIPRKMELTATIAVWTRGRPPITASARKIGKITSPKRGIESSGQRSLGRLSGIAMLTAANSP